MEWLAGASALGSLAGLFGSMNSASNAQSLGYAQLNQAYMNYALQQRALEYQRQQQQEQMRLARQALSDQESNTRYNRSQAADAIQREIANTDYARGISENNTAYSRAAYENERTYSRGKYADETAYDRALQKQLFDYAQQENAKQDALATATRVDAAGNKTYYDKATNTWVSQPTDATRGVILAKQLADREQAVNGAIRREQGQRANAESRRNSGLLADATMRLLSNNAGGPTYGGVAGRDKVARATAAGENTSALIDAMSRNAIRSGVGNSDATARSLEQVGTVGAGKLRTALAESDASAPRDYQQQHDSYVAGMLNNWAPLNASRTNITDAPVGVPTIANPDNESAYAAAYTGRGLQSAVANHLTSGTMGSVNRATPDDIVAGGNSAILQGLNANNAAESGVNSAIANLLSASRPISWDSLNGAQNGFRGISVPQMPWGSAAGALTDTITSLLRRYGGGGGSDWTSGAGNAFNNWSFNTGRDPSYQGGGGF